MLEKVSGFENDPFPISRLQRLDPPSVVEIKGPTQQKRERQSRDRWGRRRICSLPQTHPSGRMAIQNQT
jgi:hypothetical protein